MSFFLKYLIFLLQEWKREKFWVLGEQNHDIYPNLNEYNWKSNRYLSFIVKYVWKE